MIEESHDEEAPPTSVSLADSFVDNDVSEEIRVDSPMNGLPQLPVRSSAQDIGHRKAQNIGATRRVSRRTEFKQSGRQAPAILWDEFRKEEKKHQRQMEKFKNGLYKHRLEVIFGKSSQDPDPKDDTDNDKSNLDDQHTEMMSFIADEDRAYIREARKLVADFPNIFSWIYLNPVNFEDRYLRDVPLLFVAVVVQVVLPIAISFQINYDLNLKDDEIDIERKNPDTLCPHSTRGPKDEFLNLGRVLAFFLTLYFGVVSTATFLGKIRGNAFLFIFSSFSLKGKVALGIGLLSQIMGLVAANLAEYTLFVTRGTDDFLLLMFTALTMTATLNSDTNFHTYQNSLQIEKIAEKCFSDKALGLGEDGSGPIPTDLEKKIGRFRFVYNVCALLLFSFVVFLTAAVTYCI